MLDYVCDWCKRAKKMNDDWILGFAAESVGMTTQRREITIVARWSSKSAAHPFAVHFCSKEHKDAYVRRLLNTQPRIKRLTRSVAGASTFAAGAVKAPASVVDNRKVPGEKPAARTGRRSGRHKQHVGDGSFSETDYIRSHGLSVRLGDGRASEENVPLLPDCWFGS
jgi:hypothetical protein